MTMGSRSAEGAWAPPTQAPSARQSGTRPMERRDFMLPPLVMIEGSPALAESRVSAFGRKWPSAARSIDHAAVADPSFTDGRGRSEFVYFADFDGLDQPPVTGPCQGHVGKGMGEYRVLVRIHPQAFEIERGFVSVHRGPYPHGRGISDQVIAGLERSGLREICPHLILACIVLVVVCGIGEDGVIGIQAHHQVQVRLWERAS